MSARWRSLPGWSSSQISWPTGSSSGRSLGPSMTFCLWDSETTAGVSCHKTFSVYISEFAKHPVFYLIEAVKNVILIVKIMHFPGNMGSRMDLEPTGNYLRLIFQMKLRPLTNTSSCWGSSGATFFFSLHWRCTILKVYSLSSHIYWLLKGWRDHIQNEMIIFQNWLIMPNRWCPSGWPSLLPGQDYTGYFGLISITGKQFSYSTWWILWWIANWNKKLLIFERLGQLATQISISMTKWISIKRCRNIPIYLYILSSLICKKWQILLWGCQVSDQEQGPSVCPAV